MKPNQKRTGPKSQVSELEEANRGNSVYLINIKKKSKLSRMRGHRKFRKNHPLLVIGLLLLGLFILSAQSAELSHLHSENGCENGASFSSFSNNFTNENLALATQHSHSEKTAVLSGLCALCAAGSLSLHIPHNLFRKTQKIQFSNAEFEISFYQKANTQLYRLYPKTSPPFHLSI